MLTESFLKILHSPTTKTFWTKVSKRKVFCTNKRCISISSEIQNALANGDPIVALESTIVTHGMPYPENLQMATKVENLIRAKGVVPATVAVLNGTPHVGLDSGQLEELATSTNTIKVARIDFPYILSR